MTEHDRPRFAVLIGYLAEAFGKPVGCGLLEAYWFALADLTIDQLEAACQQAVRDLKWMPKPKELRDLADGGTDEDHALLAWVTVSDAAWSIGSYQAVDFEDRAINAVVRMLGGWVWLLGLTGRDFEIFARQQFIEAYKVARRRQHLGEYGLPLEGLGTSEQYETPLRIGCDTGSALQKAEPRRLERRETGPQRIGRILGRVVER